MFRARSRKSVAVAAVAWLAAVTGMAPLKAGMIDGFTDDLNSAPDSGKVDATRSSGLYWDARELLIQQRSRGETYLSESFQTLDSWKSGVTGTASRSITNPGPGGTANPAQNYFVRFETGNALGSAAWISRV